jgi:hypothetical protein
MNSSTKGYRVSARSLNRAERYVLLTLSPFSDSLHHRIKSTEGATSSRLADALTCLVTKAGFTGAEATGVEATLGLEAAAGAVGAEVLPLAPTVLHAPPEVCEGGR